MSAPNQEKRDSVFRSSLSVKEPLFSQKNNTTRNLFQISNFFAVLQFWPEFLIFVCAVGGSLACYFLLRQSEFNSADATVFQDASDRGTVLVWEMDRVLGDLQTVDAFMSVSTDWNQDYFRAKFKDVTAGILDRSPGTQGLDWVPRVTTYAERSYLELQMHRQLGLGGSPSELRNTSIGPVRCIFHKNALGVNLCSSQIPQGGPFHDAWYPILFAEPVNDPTGARASNAPAILFDVSSNPVRAQAVSTAILNDAPSATSRLTLVLQIANQYGLMVFEPVYQNLPCPNNATQTCSQLAGLVDAVFAVGDLVRKSQAGLALADPAVRGGRNVDALVQGGDPLADAAGRHQGARG